MSLARSVLEGQIAEQLDAVGDPRYSNATTLIRPVLDAVFGRGWRRILNANRSYRLAMRTVVTGTDGTIALTAMDGQIGTDAQERTYKVLAAAQGLIRYAPAEFMDDPMALATTTSSPRYTFMLYGIGQVLFLPVQAGATMTVWVNHLPQVPSALLLDTGLVRWPQDYDMILVYETAARMASKGAAETEATTWFQQLADDLWKDLLADVARFTTDPLIMGASDSASDWGAQ